MPHLLKTLVLIKHLMDVSTDGECENIRILHMDPKTITKPEDRRKILLKIIIFKY